MLKIVPQEELAEYIGADLGHGEWMTIDQERINQFADVTIDHQFIHVDPEAAKVTPWGTTIAHGFLTLSLLVHLGKDLGIRPENAVMGINYGFDKVRFLQPVKVGSEVRMRSKVLDVTERRPGQFLVKYDVAVEIKGEDTPALIAEWLGMTVTRED